LPIYPEPPRLNVRRAPIAVGAFDAKDMLSRIGKAFARIKPGPALPKLASVEPEQKGERRITVEGEGLTSYVDVAYRAPEARHADFAPLVVLDAILSGASGLSLFGGGTTNASSRLYRALVDTELATDVSGSSVPTHDPYMYAISATVRQGQPMARSPPTAAGPRATPRLPPEPQPTSR